MAVLYTSIAKEAHIEQIIDRSRFIAHACPVSSREEADAYIKSIKQQYKDATHNVPAFIIGQKQELMWASDDGEPAGTSGPPIMQYLQREGLTNLVVVVTRYFGGIKLGTGGLVRAYQGSAKLVVEEAGIHQVKDMVRMLIDVPYTALGKIQNNEKSMPFTIENISYGANISLALLMEPEYTNEVSDMLANLLNGKYINEPQLIQFKA